MSDTLATYAFLPWLRQGVAREITRADGSMTGQPRATVPITLRLDAAGDARAVTVDIALFGPGEVASVDPLVVIRTIPKPDEIDAEPNYFPSIEFDQADFPWRFTPARANAGERLRPWLVLVVLRDDEIESESAALGDGTLPAIVVSSANAVPLLDQSWAWAHVQIDGFDASSEAIQQVMTDAPARVRSRLIAARRLLPRTRYRAFLVPAFERGRRTGLRETLDDSIDGLTLAWQPGDIDIRLPYYYAWSFQTGEKGDFESMVRRLRARAVDDGVGMRDMDVSVPDVALPAAASTPLAMEGALMSPAAQSTVWDATEMGAFTTPLAVLLNQPTEVLTDPATPPIVAPPLWVRWQAAQDRLLTSAGARPPWFHDLNADPRHRSAAGLGAEIVRRNDQHLMAAAWEQVEGILEANAELRGAQVSRAASERLLDRYLAPLSTDAFLTVTAPLHTHFTLSPITVHERLRQSPIPLGALGGTMRRVLRPAGPIGRSMARLRAPDAAPLLERLNTGEVRARPPQTTPEGMLTPDRFNDALFAAGAFPKPARNARLWWGIALVFLLVAIILLFVSVPFAIVSAILGGIALVAGWRSGLDTGGDALTGKVLEGTATPEDIEAMEPAPAYVPGTAIPGAWRAGPAEVTGLTPQQTAEVTDRFQRAFADLVGVINAPPAPGPEWLVADLPAIATSLTQQMDPYLTIPAAIQHRLTIADWVTWHHEDPLEPILAAPHIDTPMYEPLRDFGQDWLMPGVNTIPSDTATLVVTNQSFIEAYMAGLSHEMSRELLYHEYPTDQRGTYFRQFWDVRGVIGADGTPPDPETLRDISEIHTWSSVSALGVHSGRTPTPREGSLVLLIKGEVLRRYPDTMVYAVRTIMGEDGMRTLGEKQLFPIFEGRLKPDISFFGFDLLPEEVRGDPDPDEDQGWYFLLQEQPTEPVFGLDADDGRYGGQPTSWNDLNWANLAADAAELGAISWIDLDTDLPNTTAVVPAAGEPSLAWHADRGNGDTGANGSDLAWITLQRPFRVAIHGSDMLPPEVAP